MKNIALSLFVLLGLASCKEVTTESTSTNVNGDTTTVVTTTTNEIKPDVETDSAKARWERARENLRAAIAKGDKKATESAQKTADEAEAAWNKLKSDVRESADKTKDALEEARENTKEKYNETLENAKAK